MKNVEELRLDLPVNGRQAAKTVWKIMPYVTRTIMNVYFHASTTSNYTGYIRLVSFSFLGINFFYTGNLLKHFDLFFKLFCRVKTDFKDDVLFIPIDITVTNTPGLYFLQDKFEFGYGSSGQEPSIFPLEVINSGRKPIKVNVSPYYFIIF